MNQRRPLPILLSPPKLQNWLLYRFYCARRDRWLPLYRDAQLKLAPEVKMQLFPGDLVSDQLAFTGSYEPELSRRVIELGRKGGTLIDVGANLGYFSFLWTSSNASNRVIAFEAAPRNLQILRSNMARNGVDGRMRLVPCAASSEAGKVSFDPGPEEQCGWGGITLEKQERAIEVEAVRVDETVALDEPVAMLKVDTEGADTLVLMGCDGLLKRGMVKEIWFEQNKPRMELLGIEPDAAQKFLATMGYTCTAHGDLRGPVVQWVAVPQ